MTYHSKPKRKRCKECNKLFVPFNSTQKVCNYKCAIALNYKVKKQNKENLNNLIAEDKAKKSLSKHIKNTVQIVHRYIRERDKGKPCISCGAPYKDDFDAGHFFPAGKFTALKFDYDNINGQCIQCNRFNEGNFELYSLSLPNRIGMEKYQELIKRAKTTVKTAKKWTRDELNKIKADAKAKIKKI